MLNVEQVSKRFEQVESPLLTDIDLRVNAGESVAIMGASGSGKSTLLNMIAGLVACDSGTISICDQTITQQSETDRDAFRAENIGLVFQQFNLIDCLSVVDNITLPARYLGNNYEEQLDHLLSKLGITQLKDKSIDKLSGGEQQRVAIARSLIHSPPLILADEPTGNLDEKTSIAVANLLFELAKSFNSALVIVTHAQDVASRADRILTIHNGTLHSQ